MRFRNEAKMTGNHPKNPEKERGTADRWPYLNKGTTNPWIRVGYRWNGGSWWAECYSDKQYNDQMAGSDRRHKEIVGRSPVGKKRSEKLRLP